MVGLLQKKKKKMQNTNGVKNCKYNRKEECYSNKDNRTQMIHVHIMLKRKGGRKEKKNNRLLCVICVALYVCTM